MAGRMLAGRLVLLAHLFTLAGLSLSWDHADFRPPGRGEGEGGTGRYCPFCHQPLSYVKNVLICDNDGEISESAALLSPPPNPPPRTKDVKRGWFGRRRSRD